MKIICGSRGSNLKDPPAKFTAFGGDTNLFCANDGLADSSAMNFVLKQEIKKQKD